MSKSSKKTIVVPWDFTEASEIAFQHAFQLAQVVGDNIALVCLLPAPGMFGNKDKHLEEMEEVRIRLVKEGDRLSAEYEEKRKQLEIEMQDDLAQKRDLFQVNIMTVVLGYTKLDKVFVELYNSMDVNLVVTMHQYHRHGKKIDLVAALRKVKLIKTESMPFIVVNAAPKHKIYSQLVVPMDYDKSSKETIRWVAYLSDYYHCNVNIIKPPLRDEKRKRQMANNLYFAKMILSSKDIVYGLKIASSKGQFSDEVFKFATDIDADMLIVMTNKFELFFHTKQINIDFPVMLINPLSKKFQSFY